MSATIDDKKLNGAGLATLWGIIKQYIVDNPSIPKATASTLGCIMVGTTLGVNNSGVLNLASGVVTAGTYKSVTVDTYGRVTAGTNPNTLAGYGITDAKIVNGSIILGENSITPITSLSGYATQTWVQQQGYLTEETYKGTVTQVKVGTTAYDPTSGVVSLPAYPTTLPASDVYSWAKAASKPSYTASEVGAATSGHTHTTSLASDSGTSTITLASAGKYKLTAGGTSVIFTMPTIPTVSYPVTSVNSKTGAVTLTASDVGAATSGHTHTTSIATSSGTNQLTLAFGTKYVLTAGGTSYIFTMPSNPNTNTTYKFTIGSTTNGDATNGVDLGTLKSETAAASGTTLSLVTTGEKATWNAKSNLTIGTTATTAAAGNHTHTLSIATSSGTNALTLAANTKYVLTAGGSTFIFTTPTDTNTWRPLGTGATDACAGNDSRLSDSRPASDVYSWAKASSKPTYTASEVGAATSSHTHTTSIATSTGTNQITLAHGGKYAITAGGTSYIFTMPSDNNTTYSAGTGLSLSGTTFSLATSGVTAGTYKRVTVDAYGRVTSGDNTDANDNTWRNIYTGGTSRVGTGTDTKAINFVAGSNVSISYEAAGTGSGQSGNANYFNVKIAATDTTYSAATQSAAGLMSAADKKKLDGIASGANAYSLPTASSSTLGGVKVGTTLSISSSVLNLATSGVTAGTYKRVTVDSYGRVTSGDNTDADTNTWRGIYVKGTSSIGTSIDTKALNFAAGSNVSISFAAAGTGSGQSGNANYGTITINATDTTYSAATQSAAGLMSAADKKKLDGIAAGANAYSLPTASSSALGGIKVGASVSGKNYAVQLDSSNCAYVNVPWTDNNTTYTQASLGQVYAYSTPPTSGTAVTATNSDYVLATGGILAVQFDTNPVPASATLNVNSKGAKNIKYKKAALAAGVIKAGDLATFMYDGAQYELLTVDRTMKAVTGISRSGTTFTATCVDGSTFTFTQQDNNTTYTLDGLMGSSAKGGTTQPIYWNGSAFANTTYTLGKSVPSDAVFTDTNTWRTVQCNGTSIGNNTLNLKAGTNISLSNSSGTITITATDTNTTYSAGTGISLSGTTFSNSGVRSTAINGNYLRVNTNGTNADLTIPYATNANYASVAGYSGYSNMVLGSYTNDGGQQNPNYFGVTRVGFLMMNTTVNGNSQYKDWVIMDCYGGNDAGGGVAIGVNRQSLGAYIMRSDSVRTSWAEKAELLGTHNYSNYALPLTGGTLTGSVRCFEFKTSDYTRIAKGSSISSYLSDDDLALYAYNGSSFQKISCYCSEFVIDNVCKASNFIQTSDIRTKNIICNANIAINDVANAPIFSFTWKDSKIDTNLHIGTSAQYWQIIVPQVVYRDNDGMGTLSMQYDVAALMSVISVAKETLTLKEKVALLETRVESLEKKIREYESN